MMRMEPHRSHSFGASVFNLIGHVAGGAVLFASLAGLSWLLGWGIAQLHSIHPFSDSVLRLLHGVELVLLYLDIGLSGIVLLVGAVRFLKEMAGGHYG